jgi:hypothetical protein
MASENPRQTREGSLIEGAANASGLSVKKLAANAGISDTRWRHIVRGWQPAAGGGVAPVVGPAPTLARMAFAVGISAEELARTGRTDAADLLARIEAQGDGSGMPLPSTRASRSQADEIDMIDASQTMTTRQKLQAIRTVLRLRAELEAEQAAMQKAPASDAGASEELDASQG